MRLPKKILSLVVTLSLLIPSSAHLSMMEEIEDLPEIAWGQFILLGTTLGFCAGLFCKCPPLLDCSKGKIEFCPTLRKKRHREENLEEGTSFPQGQAAVVARRSFRVEESEDER